MSCGKPRFTLRFLHSLPWTRSPFSNQAVMEKTSAWERDARLRVPGAGSEGCSGPCLVLEPGAVNPGLRQEYLTVRTGCDASFILGFAAHP